MLTRANIPIKSIVLYGYRNNFEQPMLQPTCVLQITNTAIKVKSKNKLQSRYPSKQNNNPLSEKMDMIIMASTVKIKLK